MASESHRPTVVEDCRGILQVLSDGSIVRSPNPSFSVPIRDDGTVKWKDLLFDPVHNLHLRLYKPRTATASAPKLPILFFFHGGGFCLGSRTWPTFHNACLRLASSLPALLLAPDYSLAPEHRLPTAISDAASAVEWIRDQAASPHPDPWLADAADFENVFISGESAGGNLAHHLALRFDRISLDPIRIRGFVLLMPFFAGTQRTKSEAECPNDAVLNLEQSDRCWRLALPSGANRDHPFANPFGAGGPSFFEPVGIAPPMLVVVGGSDLLRDRGVEYARRLKEMGTAVELVEIAGKQHGFFSTDPWSEPSDELVRITKRFIEDSGGRSDGR